MFPSIVYDHEHDILYIDVKYAVCDAENVSNGIYVRTDMENGEFVGLIIEDFLKKTNDNDFRKGILKNIGGYKLKVIDQPVIGTRAILKFPPNSNKTIFMEGKGGFDYSCGKCGIMLLKQTLPMEIPHCVFLCPKCNSYNELDLILEGE